MLKEGKRFLLRKEREDDDGEVGGTVLIKKLKKMEIGYGEVTTVVIEQ